MAQYKCQAAEMELYVVPEGGVPLLGREWLTHFRLDWPEHEQVNKVDAVPESLLCLFVGLV